MATYVEGRSAASDVEPVGLLSEGAAGIAAIVLAVIALAGISSGTLASIATIVIGVGLTVQAFNAAAEASKVLPAGTAAGVQGVEASGEVMVDCLTGIAGIILGILALVGINATHLVPAALIVFGGALLLDGAIGMRPKTATTANTAAGPVQIVSYQGSAAAGGMEILIGMAAIVLGILSLIFMASWVLVLVGFIAVGAAMLMVSASFSGAVMRLFTTPA
ncbi:MAG TPA: hypothetical protein VGF34_14000 [Stellaceae bacterium]|jgi:hypothetical protein